MVEEEKNPKNNQSSEYALDKNPLIQHETVENPSSDTERTRLQRILGPMTPGSLRGSVFSLSVLSVGTGCLSLPQRFGQMSILVAVIEVFLAGLAAYWTLCLMIIAAKSCNKSDYSKVIKHYWGKGWSKFLDVVIIIYQFGILILYQIISNSIKYSLPDDRSLRI